MRSSLILLPLRIHRAVTLQLCAKMVRSYAARVHSNQYSKAVTTRWRRGWKTLNGIFINCSLVFSVVKCVIKLKNIRIFNWKETTLQRCAKRKRKKSGKVNGSRHAAESAKWSAVVILLFLSPLFVLFLFRWKRIQGRSCVKLILDLEQWEAIVKWL